LFASTARIVFTITVFVERGNDHAHRRPVAGVERFVALAPLADQRKDDHEDDPRGSKDDAGHERNSQKQLEEIDRLEDDPVIGQHQIVGGENLRIDRVSVAIDERRHGDERVALFMKPLNEERNEFHSLGAIAAGIVKKNAVPFFASVQLLEDGIQHLLRSTMMDRSVSQPLGRVPVLRVDELEHGDVVEARRQIDRRHFSLCRRLRVRVVGRAEKQSRAVQKALQDAPRCVQLQTRFGIRNHADIRMGVRVIPDLMPLRPDAPHETGIALCVLADQKERSRDVQRFQLVEYLGRVRI